ncbi:MAG TPA: 23S rRNA (uracil(1939)-C(5))-methyltransferase RlmD [Gammaproteobacteria bacterium]|nr:23S rRNA (uracil(1939)-C(5))-methyltransferase RlmD [Gammaproteobacteria bacterium]
MRPVVEADIESLTHDGRGIARLNGKAVFVQGALPGERVRFEHQQRRRAYDEGTVIEIISPSANRVEPGCAHYDLCGGCALQHLDHDAQCQAKQQVLLDSLARIAKLTPERILPPLTGPVWGYRRRARLGVKFVRKKNRVLVGFRERRSAFITDITRCEVLDPQVGSLLAPLGEMIGRLSIADQIPQIEVAVADNAVALVLRHLKPLPAEDKAILREFSAAQNNIRFYLQPGDNDSIVPLDNRVTPLQYRLPAYDTTLQFLPADFIQINGAINEKMVDLALQLLNVQTGEQVLDLFCGLGNFSLPLARKGAQVTAVEGDTGLVRRARANAENNGLAERTEFHTANLFEPVKANAWAKRHYDSILLDPPRAGAREIIEEQFSSFKASRIVYVSCHPGSLARDAALLCANGYKLSAAGVIDMFPHTAHSESIALFELT